MPIVGIGIDIIEICRIKKIVLIFKNKFAKKILTYREYIEYKKNKDPIRFLAKRFASKEAAAKAIGKGFQNGITFKHFEVYKNFFGKPKIKFFKEVKKIKNILKVKDIHITITDEKNYACALVILES